MRYLRNNVPGMQALLAPVVTREQLAKVAVSAAVGDIAPPQAGTPIFTIDDIKKFADASNTN